MTTLALAAPTTFLGSASGSTPGPLLSTGLLLPTAETSMASNAGFSFPNNGQTVLRVVIGSAGTGNLTFVFQRTIEGQAPASMVISVANSTQYFFGPFSPADFNDGNGLFQGLLSVPTGNSVGVYLIAQSVYGK